MTSHSSLHELQRRAGGEPRQKELFTHDELVTSAAWWCWTVELRILAQSPFDPNLWIWEDWQLVRRPNHFRSEESAVARLAEIKEEYKPHAKAFEGRVKPKYLGHVPDADEKWIEP